MTAKKIKEQETEEAILRQSQACHSAALSESYKRAKGRGKEVSTDVQP